MPQNVFKRLAQMNPSQAASRVSIESDAFVFHYLIEADVCYLTLTDRGYPKKLAYQYLEELQSEFSRLYGPQIEGIARPYAFIKFGASPYRQQSTACVYTLVCPALSCTAVFYIVCMQQCASRAQLWDDCMPIGDLVPKQMQRCPPSAQLPASC